jgi:hypothetical protein
MEVKGKQIEAVCCSRALVDFIGMYGVTIFTFGFILFLIALRMPTIHSLPAACTVVYQHNSLFIVLCRLGHHQAVLLNCVPIVFDTE